MEKKETVDKQTSGLGEVFCSNCRTKIRIDDLEVHFHNCRAQTGEMGFQTTMGKYFFCLQCNLIKINFDVRCARKDIKTTRSLRL